MAEKSKLIKAIGVAATIIGVGVNLITDWVNEQKMDEKIDEKVNAALAKKMMKRKSPNSGLFYF